MTDFPGNNAAIECRERIKTVHLQPTSECIWGVGWALRVRELKVRGISIVEGMSRQALRCRWVNARKSEATNQAGRCRSDWPPVGLSIMRRSHSPQAPPVTCSPYFFYCLSMLGKDFRLSFCPGRTTSTSQRGSALDGLQ